MLSNNYFPVVGNTDKTTTQMSPHNFNIESKETCLCFVCDKVTNGDSVQLQQGHTTHTKTGLPIKLGQLIGDDFMVIVSVDDRLCIACIKLINLVDRLEVELNRVKKVITEHLKTKYQLPDVNIDNPSGSSSNASVISDQSLIEGDKCKIDVETHSAVAIDSDKLPVDEVNDKLIRSEPELSFSIKQSQNIQTDLFDIKEMIENSSDKVQVEDCGSVTMNDGIVNLCNVKNSDSINRTTTKEITFDRSCGDNSAGNYSPTSNKCIRSSLVNKCTLCEDEFQTHALLQKHIISKHLTKCLCYFCNVTFENDSDYQKHMKMHVNNINVQHSSNDAGECVDFSDNGSMNTDKQNEIRRYFKCKFCKFKTKSDFLLEKHEKDCYVSKSGGCKVNESKALGTNFKCSLCMVWFKTKKQLSVHACTKVVDGTNSCDSSSSHPPNNGYKKQFKFQCGICPEKFGNKSFLITHLRSHKIDNNLVNPHNDTDISRSNSDVNSNIEIIDQPHLTESNEDTIISIQCPQCSLVFNDSSKCNEHVNEVHKNTISVDITSDSVNEIYFGNENFMPLSTSVIDDGSTLSIMSNKLIKSTLVNFNRRNDDLNSETMHEENKLNVIGVSNVIVCEKCNMSFDNKNELEKHSLIFDHKNVQYQSFIKMDEFDNIKNNYESTKNILDDKDVAESSPFVNEIIINSFNTSQDDCDNKYEGAMNNNLSCHLCTFVADTVVELKQHESCDHGVTNCESGESMTECNICHKYISKCDINHHYKSNHKNMSCNSCSFETKNKKLMRKHIKEHNNKVVCKDKQQGYMCQYCKETFKTKKLLQTHEELHPENFEFNCELCGKKFLKEKQLNKHSEVHRDPHCCYCGKEILNLRALKCHEQRHTRDIHNAHKLECSICKRIFKTRTGLRHHVAIHTGKYKYTCEFCQRGFMSRMMLEEHRSCHTKEDRYVCDVCGRKFTFQSTYWIHRKWHDNPFPYKCNFCGRLFRHTSLLSVHKRKHTGERPYKCPHCPLSFTVGGTLKRHLILHTQKFPFNCETCKRGFTTKHKYSMHLIKAHNNYEMLVNKKSQVKSVDYKMVVKEKAVVETNEEVDDDNRTEKLSMDTREQSDTFEFINDNNFTLVNIEGEDDDNAGNTNSIMPCIMSINNEENSGLVFGIISSSSLQQISNGINMPETILPDMWCQ